MKPPAADRATRPSAPPVGRKTSRRLCAAVALASCTPHASHPSQIDPPERDAVAYAVATAPIPPTLGPLAIEPRATGDGILPFWPTAAIESGGGTMMDHATTMGWSSDGSTFVACTSGAEMCESCEFVSLDGVHERVGTHWPHDDLDARDECSPERTQILRARLEGGRYALSQDHWALGTTHMLRWTSRAGDWEGEPSRLHVFARRHDADVGPDPTQPAPSDLEVLSSTSLDYPELHIEVIAPDPTGTILAIVTHGFAGEWTDHFEIHLIETRSLVAIDPSTLIATAPSGG